MKRPKGVSLDRLLPAFEDQLSITVENFSHLICLILGIHSKLADDNCKWLDHLVERRTAVWEVESSCHEPDQHS